MRGTVPVRRSWLARAVRGPAAVALVAALLPAAAIAGRAGSGQGPVTGAPSTLAGIYTSTQATRGEETYFALCVGCHPAGTYTGPGFRATWGGRPLFDLYEWVKDKMPKNDPGALTPRESIQVVAYILKLNNLPAGRSDLAADPAALRKIALEFRK